MSQTQTPIERYLMGEASLEETKAALRIKTTSSGKSCFPYKEVSSRQFQQNNLNPVHPNGEEMFLFKSKRTEVVSFKVSPEMRKLLDAFAECEQRNLSNFMECMIRDYFSRQLSAPESGK